LFMILYSSFIYKIISPWNFQLYGQFIDLDFCEVIMIIHVNLITYESMSVTTYFNICHAAKEKFLLPETRKTVFLVSARKTVFLVSAITHYHTHLYLY